MDSIQDFERVSLGFGVIVVNTGKIDEGEETKDFEKELRKLNFIVL